MNAKAARKLIEQNGFKIVRWEGSFRVALLANPNGGEPLRLYTDKGKETVASKLQKLKQTKAALMP
jgi:predicted RNA binding protein YcfA (HicA-like mRNA interferase family)